jgi:hypothetical protein
MALPSFYFSFLICVLPHVYSIVVLVALEGRDCSAGRAVVSMRAGGSRLELEYGRLFAVATSTGPLITVSKAGKVFEDVSFRHVEDCSR